MHQSKNITRISRYNGKKEESASDPKLFSPGGGGVGERGRGILEFSGEAYFR